MEKPKATKTQFHDWLLINTLKDRNEDSIPEDFTVREEEREAVRKDDSEGKLALLARLAREKYPAARRGIECSDLLLWLSPVPVFLVLWLIFGGVTLSGVDKLPDGNTGVKLGLFLSAITFQYVVIIICVCLWALYLLRRGMASLFGSTGKVAPHSLISLKSLVKQMFTNPIGIVVIASHSVVLSVFSRRNRENVSFVYFARQYQNHPRTLQLFAHTFAQIFWFLLALISIVLFAYSSGGGNNRFYYPDSMLYPEYRLYWVQTIQNFTWVQFTEEEIIEVVNREDLTQISTRPAESQNNENRNNEKVKWTWFMISALVPPLVVRFILFLLIRHLFVASQKDFKPDPKEEFYRNLIEKIFPIGIINAPPDSTDSSEPMEPLPPEEPLVLPVSTGPPKTLIFMPNLHIPKELWQECFPGEEHRNIYVSQDCRDEAGRMVQEQIQKGEIAVGKIIFAFSLTDNPDTGKMTFVKETAGAFWDKTFVLLSCANDLRQQMNNHSLKMAVRREEWQFKLVRAGVLSEHIIDWFDHKIEDAANRKRLRAFFRGYQEDFRLAGKYEKASELILAGVREIFEDYAANPQSFAPEIWDARPVVDERFESCRAGISKLYAEEEKKLKLSASEGNTGEGNAPLDLTKIKQDAAKILGSVSEKAQQLGNDSIQESIAWGCWLGKVQKTLKPRGWAALGGTVLGTAVVGAALAQLGPVGMAVAPYVVSACGGGSGVLGFFAPEMSQGVFQISKGMFRKKNQENFQANSANDIFSSVTNEAEANFRIEVSTFMTSLAAWAAIHELQGLPPEDLAERLTHILEPLETANADSLESIKEAFTQSRQFLNPPDFE